MIKKLFIRPYFGNLPEYMDRYVEETERIKQYGFDYLLFTDREEYQRLIKEKIGITYDFTKGNLWKPSEFRPCFGLIFEDYIKGYDFWGHTDMDVVYGKLDNFLTDSFLNNIDIFGNDPDAMCGPFSLYRNILKANNIFRDVKEWQYKLLDHGHYEFDEKDISVAVRAARDCGKLRVAFRFWQGNDKTRHELVRKTNGVLLCDGEEIMMYHFKEGKKWPDIIYE